MTYACEKLSRDSPAQMVRLPNCLCGRGLHLESLNIDGQGRATLQCMDCSRYTLLTSEILDKLYIDGILVLDLKIIQTH